VSNVLCWWNLEGEAVLHRNKHITAVAGRLSDCGSSGCKVRLVGGYRRACV
jgi:hypothetical protein